MTLGNTRLQTLSALFFLAIMMLTFGCQKKLTYGVGLPDNYAAAQLMTHNQMAYNKPNSDLMQMQKLTGYWTWNQSIWPFPGSHPVSLKGICASKWILGNRYVRLEFKYVNENADTEIGYIFIGHDQMLNTYSFYEIFSTLTSPIIGTGEWNEKKQEFRWVIEFSNPLNHAITKFIRTIHLDKSGTLTWKSWRQDINGKLVPYQTTILTPTTKEEMEKALRAGTPDAVEPVPTEPDPVPAKSNDPG